MRSTIIAAIAALAFASSASAAIDSYMGFHPDAGGRCHGPDGKFAPASKCKAPPKHCRDPKTGRFVSCVIKDNNGHSITDSNGRVITGH